MRQSAAPGLALPVQDARLRPAVPPRAVPTPPSRDPAHEAPPGGQQPRWKMGGPHDRLSVHILCLERNVPLGLVRLSALCVRGTESRGGGTALPTAPFPLRDAAGPTNRCHELSVRGDTLTREEMPSRWSWRAATRLGSERRSPSHRGPSGAGAEGSCDSGNFLRSR